MKKESKRKLRLYFAAFLLPMLLLKGCLAVAGVKSLLTADMLGQYAAFYTYARNVFSGTANALYSFSCGLGAGTAGLWGYYLLSPVNVLLLLFSPENMPDAVLLMTYVKVGLCALAMTAALPERGQGMVRIALGVCYALGGYVIGYMQNLMWLDAVALLPLIVRALLDMLGGQPRARRRYALLLALALASNFYTGYMICMACVLCAVCYVFAKKAWGRLGDFAFYSVLGGGLAGVALVPSALALLGGKGGEALAWTVQMRYSWQELLASFLPIEGGANVYIGTLCTVVALGYFFLARRSLRERLTVLALFVFLLCSMQSSVLERIWHGFQMPIGFPLRNAFVLSALLIAMAYALLSRISGRRGMMAMLCLLMVGEVCVAATGRLQTIYGDAQSPQAYAQAYEKTQEALSVLPRDGEFYRVEKTYDVDDLNRALTNDYAGVSHFSSVQKQPVKEALRRLGLYNEMMFYTSARAQGGIHFFAGYDRGATLALDSLLGVRYVLDEGMSAHVEALQAGKKGAQVTVYENARALPLGVVAPAQIMQLSLPRDNPFAAQEAVFSALCGGEVKLFYDVEDVKRTLHNASAWADYFERMGDVSEIEYAFTAQQTGAYSTYITLGEADDALHIFANGKDCGAYGKYRTDKIVPVGNFEAGETVRVTLRLTSDRVQVKDIRFVCEDVQATRQTAEAVRRPLQSKIKDGEARFLVRAGEGDVLFTTIPFERGWTAEVNGEAVEVSTALEAFIAVPLYAGESEVVLRYRTPGLGVGALLSVLAGILLLWAGKRKGKTNAV